MTTPKRYLRVFLCHSSGDKSSVEKIYDRLVNDGIDAWLDKKNLLPGQNWKIEIPKAVRDSDVVIVFLSSQSVNKEGFVQKEIKIALDTADEKPEGTIFIIPARLENCEVPERIAQIHWVDLFESDGYTRLLKALQIRAKNLNIKIKRKRVSKKTNKGTDIQPDSEIFRREIKSQIDATLYTLDSSSFPIYLPQGLETVERKIAIMGFRNFKKYKELRTGFYGIVVVNITNIIDEKNLQQFIKKTNPDPSKTAIVLYAPKYRISDETMSSYDNLHIANTIMTVANTTWLAARTLI